VWQSHSMILGLGFYDELSSLVGSQGRINKRLKITHKAIMTGVCLSLWLN